MLRRPEDKHNGSGLRAASAQALPAHPGKVQTEQADMENENIPDNGPKDEKPELALDFDFTPDWARKPPENPYAGREDAGAEFGDGGGRPPFRRGGGGGFRRGGDRREGGFRRDGGNRERRDGDRNGPRREGGGFRDRGPRRDGAPSGGPGGFRKDRPEGPRGERPPRRDGERGPRRDGDRRGDRRGPPREPLPRLDVNVAFLPDRERLALVARDIQASRRAFPLIHIANLFLGGDDRYLVKLELPPPKQEGEPRKLFAQCLDCHRAFLSRANAEAHVLNEHIGKFFDIEEIEVEPPSGTYTCVARCQLSGELLGPPNDHSYNERLQELWSTRFSHMPKSEYLSHIETVRDEALVEQWKESMRKKTVYRLKAEYLPKPKPAEGEPAPAPAPAAEAEAPAEPAPEAAPEAPAEAPAAEAAPAPEPPKGPAMTKAEAQDWMRNRVNGMLRESARCMLPGAVSRRFDDPSLRREVSMAWQRETRFPFTLSLALRPAFRHMKMHLFKINARETYVTAIAPVPVDLATAPDIVKEIVAFLEANPGATRQSLRDGLRPGADAESKEVQDLLRHLDNLVANGNVIAFYNGTLGLPRAQAEKPKAEAAAEKPAEEKPAEEAPAAPADAETAPAEAAEKADAPDATPAAVAALADEIANRTSELDAAAVTVGDLAGRLAEAATPAEAPAPAPDAEEPPADTAAPAPEAPAP